MRTRSFSFWLAVALWSVCSVAAPAARSAIACPMEGFAAVNGVRLQYLDWGGAGPSLILIHGLGDDPHVFQDLAPALMDRFRVIAYARRGSGSSDPHGPYDNVTLTEDLRRLMDALGIVRAHLLGVSAGGNEVTEMAARHPDRVRRIIYLDAAFDWADPDFHVAFQQRPVFERPAGSMASFEAFRSFEGAMTYPALEDLGRVETYLRKRIVVRADGSVAERIRPDVRSALYAALFANERRDYTAIRAPALAVYAEHWYPVDVADAQRRNAALAYDTAFKPFKEKSIERVRREIGNVQVVHVPGAHGNFLITSREQVLEAIWQFLGEPSPGVTQ